MHRRTFLSGSLGLAATLAISQDKLAAQGTPDATAALPELAIGLTDTGFEFPQPLSAGRYRVTVTNKGPSTESHFAFGRIPDGITDEQYEEWLNSDDDTESLSMDDIGFVGVPDWPQPDKPSTGVIDLHPGKYILFDPFLARGYLTLAIDGDFVPAAEPESEVAVMLHEMAIMLPETAFSTQPARWKIENGGAMVHEVAVLAVSPDFTEEHLQIMFSLPDDATPPPGVPELEYLPVAAIGLLAKQHTTWLDVQFDAGHYVAICMAPFGTGYPHGIDGMYRFFEVT